VCFFCLEFDLNKTKLSNRWASIIAIREMRHPTSNSPNSSNQLLQACTGICCPKTAAENPPYRLRIQLNIPPRGPQATMVPLLGAWQHAGSRTLAGLDSGNPRTKTDPNPRHSAHGPPPPLSLSNFETASVR
jgi:hypothetical protein